MIAAGAFEAFYLRIFTIDRARLRANLIELPYRKLPGLRAMLTACRDRTRIGETVAVTTPFKWEEGDEYVYARSLYPLAGRKVVRDPKQANATCAYEGGHVAASPDRGRDARVPAAETAAVLVALLVGYALRERVGEGLLLGIAVCSALLLILPWSRIVFVVIAAVAAVAAIALLRLRRPRVNIRAFAFGIPALILLIGYARFATTAPLWEFDYLVDWGLKAKEFFIAHHLNWPFLEVAWYRGTHPDYPPLLPLAFDTVSVLRGFWSDEWLGLLNVAFAAGALLAMHRFARDDVQSDAGAAFIVFAMVPFAAVPWIGLAEAPFIAYATTGVLLMRRSTTAGAVMLGCAALTKNEGISLIVAAAIALLVVRRGSEIARAWPAVVIPMPWWIMRAAHHLPTDITSGNVASRVMQHLADPTFLTALTNYSLGKPLFWIALAAGILMTFRTLDRFVVTALALQLLFYIGAYLATPHDVAWHVQWSWERLIAHLTPALTYLVLSELVLLSWTAGFSRPDRPLQSA